MAEIKSNLVMDGELVATCNALGSINKETKRYDKSEDCEACLLDIRRFLMKDDTKSQQTKDFVTRRSLSQIGVVVNDFIPLLKEHCDENDALFKTLVHLLLSLSAPTILLFEEKLPTDKLEKQRYLELIEINRSIKIAFGSSILIWKPFFNFMTNFISTSWEHRDIDQRELFQRILLFIRNILLIPLDTALDRTAPGELNPHDRLVSVFDKAGILELILLLASSDDEVSHYCFHILEVIPALLREQNAEFLAKCYNPSEPEADRISRSAIERETDHDELKLLVAREKDKSRRVKPFYSRFKEATFEVKNVKSLSDKNMIVHKVPQNLELTTLGYRKQNSKRNKNNANLTDINFSGDGVTSRSPPHITRILSKFCHEFLKSYNNLMDVTEMNLARAKNASNDETYYLWAAYFFMQFNRFSQPDASLVSQTFSVKAMHDFHTYIESYLAKLSTEKKIFLPWSRRLHYALQAYRELIFTLAFSDSSGNPEFVEVNKAVKTSVFYEDDYRELLLKLIKDFNPVKMSRSYLVDLVMTNHAFLKLLKVYCKSQPRVEVNEKRPRKKKKSKKKSNPDEPVDLNECWENLETGLTAAVKGLVVLPSPESDEDVIPLDPSVDFEDNIQKLAIVQRINRLLKEEKAATAVALLRNARESWPNDEDNLFGNKDCHPEEEMEVLKKILHFESVPDQADSKMSEGESDDEHKEGNLSRKPTQITYDAVFKKYCHSKAIQAYAVLLKNFVNNSDELNHVIVKLFFRIAVDFELYQMFFQASLFRIFQEIMKCGEKNEGVRELAQFGKYIVKKFVALAPTNEMMMVELLFWKSASLAPQLTSGYSDSKISNEEEAN